MTARPVVGGNTMKSIPVVALLVRSRCAGVARCSLRRRIRSKPVRIVVSWPPGGSNDVVARVLAQRLTEVLGQTFIVENRAGATGTIGSDLVAKSPPDGYTILVNSATHVANPHIYKKLPYDTMKDFTGVMPLAVQIGMLVVHPALPAKIGEGADSARKIEAGPDRLGFHGHRQLHLGHHGAAPADDRDEDAGGATTRAAARPSSRSPPGKSRCFSWVSGRSPRLFRRGASARWRRVRQAAEAVPRHSDGRGDGARATS